MNKKIVFASILLSITSIVSNVSARSYPFEDVPPTAWYMSYVDELFWQGVIDGATMFRPAESLNRAELVKMVITATGGLEGHTPPSTPTFDDVPPTAWFANYVEFAATKGIVTGYSDAQGNLIGLFGPNDTVSRAAATKILVSAFELEVISGDSSDFLDMNEGDWFYNYVSIASQHNVVSGYSTGVFGPADPVTRAQISKMIVLSSQAAGIMDGTEPEEEEEVAEEIEVEVEVKVETEEEELPDASANSALLVEANTPAGFSEAFVGKYVFHTNNEGFHVETVTIVNDITGDMLGDQTEGTPAIKNVILKFPDENGKLKTASRSLDSSGKARFSNLEFFAERDEDTFFEVYAELNKISEVGESLSGEVFRLGIQDVNNDANSFRAVGAISGFVKGYAGTGSFAVSNATVEPFTVRKSVPSFSMNSTSSTMSNGENTLISYNVAASPEGSIGLARLVFEIAVFDSNGAGLSLDDFKLFSGSSLMNNVNIYDSTGGQDLGLGSGGSLVDGTSFVIVSFDNEEIVTAGSSETYSLKASTNGSEKDDDVSTRIAQGDENTPLSGLTAMNQANTGKVYVDGDATAGIFTTAALDLGQWLGSAKNIIWSDKSAKSHLYPGVMVGSVTDDSGSADWTNGYLLNLSALSDHVISK